jgi:hypothetical protein
MLISNTRNRLVLMACGAFFIGLTIQHALAQQGDYRDDLDWAANDTGAPDCPALYASTL